MATSEHHQDKIPSLAKAERTMKEIKRRANKYQLQELPVEALERMDAELAERQSQLVRCAQDIDRRIDALLQEGSGLIISDLRVQIRQIAKEHRELGIERGKIYDARQQRILEDRLIGVLGSKGRVKALEWFIIVLIVGVVGLLVYDLAYPGLGESGRALIGYIDLGACVIFLAEFFFRHRYAESKRWFWRRHWIDFATSLWIPNLEALRLGRLVRLGRIARLIRLARLLRVLRVIFFFWRGMDKLQDVLDVRMMKRSLFITIMILLVGAALIWVAESGNEDTSGVDSFGESIWWSFTTVVTGGFGDIHNPETVAGRIVTVILIIVGMIVVGIFIATLTSVLVGDESELLLANQRDLADRFNRLEVIVEAIAKEQEVELPPRGDPSAPE